MDGKLVWHLDNYSELVENTNQEQWMHLFKRMLQMLSIVRIHPGGTFYAILHLAITWSARFFEMRSFVDTQLRNSDEVFESYYKLRLNLSIAEVSIFLQGWKERNTYQSDEISIA